MAWSRDQLERIGQTQVLRVSSYRPDGSLRRWTPIWVVRIGDHLYVRSAFGRDSDWYRNAMRHQAARIRAGDIETDVALQPVNDTTTNAEVEEAYKAKYGDQPGALRPMLEPAAAETTVRLDLAE